MCTGVYNGVCEDYEGEMVRFSNGHHVIDIVVYMYSDHELNTIKKT